MPNIAKMLKEEITRLARKEVRVSLERTRKSVALQQREIAGLKARVKELARQVSVLERGLARPAPALRPDSASKQVRFVPKGLVSTRKRLGLSAAELAGLMGVTSQTIYNWEGGTTRPNPAQVAKLASLRSVGKRQMRAHLAASHA
jgi:DNA-binding XRE family transcriptional regulator